MRGVRKVAIVVLAPEKIFGFGRVLLWALLHSGVTTLFTAISCRTSTIVVLEAARTGVLDNRILLYAILMAALPTAAPIPWLYRHIPGWRILAYSVIYTLGLLAWKEGVAIPLLGTDITDPFLTTPGIAINFLFATNLLAVGLLASSIPWFICRLRYGRVVPQDGTRCPNCAYSLIGVPRQVCPECGREFTLQELGIALGQPIRPVNAPTTARPVVLGSISNATNTDTSDDGPHES